MKRTQIRRRSAKKAITDEAYKTEREKRIFLCGGACEGNTPACPTGLHDGAHGHHIDRRRGPHDYLTLRWLCSAAHAYVHANPAWSYDHGLLIRSSAEL